VVDDDGRGADYRFTDMLSNAQLGTPSGKSIGEGGGGGGGVV
jgi:hypothetical protein